LAMSSKTPFLNYEIGSRMRTEGASARWLGGKVG
jgi:hypothetical protein